MSNRRTFFQYVIPSVLSFALSGVYAIVDGFFVGNSIGDAGLSAINIAYPVTAVLQAVGTGLGMGGAVRYSILKAEGNEEKAREYIAAATWLMLLFSVILTGAVYLASKSILSALGASGELLTLGDEYIRVIALGAVLQIFGTGLVPFMRNYGGSVWAMIAMICGFAANIVLDYAFVWVLNQGMHGAALATVIGQGITMAVALVYCAAKKNLALKVAAADAPDIEDRPCPVRPYPRTEHIACYHKPFFGVLWRTGGDRGLCLHIVYNLHRLSAPAGRRRRKPAAYEPLLRRRRQKIAKAHKNNGV